MEEISDSPLEAKQIDSMAMFYAEEVANRTATLPDNKLKAVKLFGSHSQGTAKDNSDVDVLVIWEGIDSQRKREDITQKIYDAMGKGENSLATEGLHILVVTPDEYENPDPKEDSVLLNLKKHGTIDVSLPQAG